MRKIYIEVGIGDYVDCLLNNKNYVCNLLVKRSPVNIEASMRMFPENLLFNVRVGRVLVNIGESRNYEAVFVMKKKDHRAALRVLYTELIWDAIGRGKDYEADEKMYEARKIARFWEYPFIK